MTLPKFDMSRYPDRKPRQILSSPRVVPPVLRPNSRTLPNLESSSKHTPMCFAKMATQIQKLGLHVPICRRYVARATVFPGTCREMSKTPTNRDRRQISKRISRHVRLGQIFTRTPLWLSCTDPSTNVKHSRVKEITDEDNLNARVSKYRASPRHCIRSSYIPMMC